MASKLYVGGLAYSMGDDELSDAFKQYGSVVSASVIKDRDSGQSKGFGFVEMSSDEEAQAAIKGLDNQELSGRRVRVNEARPREDRPQRSFN